MIFVFNGDADGLSSLIQFYQTNQSWFDSAQFVTDVKRKTQLLSCLTSVQNEEMIVLDIEVEKNLESLLTLIKSNCLIKWFDHHISNISKITDLQSSNFEFYFPRDDETNTSILVYQYLNQSLSDWAAVGAYGDNMERSADKLLLKRGVCQSERQKLKILGQVLNYNSYGVSLEDLHFHPLEIFQRMCRYSDALTFCQNESLVRDLVKYRQVELEKSSRLYVPNSQLLFLPNETWAHRIHGEAANALALMEPQLSHGVLIENAHGGYTVSVRSAIEGNKNAAEFCRKFKTGGGRARSGGINHLRENDLLNFKTLFKAEM